VGRPQLLEPMLEQGELDVYALAAAPALDLYRGLYWSLSWKRFYKYGLYQIGYQRESGVPGTTEAWRAGLLPKLMAISLD